VRDDDFYQQDAGGPGPRRAAGGKGAARNSPSRNSPARKGARKAGRGAESRPGGPIPPADARQSEVWQGDPRQTDARRRGGRSAATQRRARGSAARTPAPKRRRRRGPPPWLYFGLAAVLVVALVAAGAVLLTHANGRPSPRAPAGREPAAGGAAPAAYSDSPSTPVFAGIGRRAADASPLTVQEVFPKAAGTLPDTAAHARLKLADSRLDADCGAAIWGRELGEELRRGGCSQVVRGAYLDEKAGYAALVTIINVATAADANRVVDVLGGNSAPGFVLPLPRGDRFDQGFSVARGRAMGHYGVIGWVRRLDGKGDEQDGRLLSLLVAIESPKAILDRTAAARVGSSTGWGG
jgi:hypothetical protein